MSPAAQETEKKAESDSDRLAALDRNLAAVQAKSEQKKEAGALKAMKMSPAMMRASRVGFEIVLAMLFGLGIGWVLDKKLGTLPLFCLLFGLLGFAAGVMNAWRAVQGVYDEVGFNRDKQDQD